MGINFWKEKKESETRLVTEEEAKKLGLPPPYKEGVIRALEIFLHGPELIARQERNRAARRKWAFRFITGKDEPEPWESED